jgi:hypothetical protein
MSGDTDTYAEAFKSCKGRLLVIIRNEELIMAVKTR